MTDDQETTARPLVNCDDERDYAIACGVNILVVFGIVMAAAFIMQVWK